jgi:hypothetical protein
VASPRSARLAAFMAERYRRLATPWVLMPALAAMAAFTLLFALAGRAVGPGGATGLGLQRAFTPARFAAAVTAWGAGVESFKTSLAMLDFAFPLVYAAGVSSLVAISAGGPAPGTWRVWIFTLPWVAAALDWTENLLHLWLLADVHTAAQAAAASYPALPVFVASAAAMTKFALLLVAAGVGIGTALPAHRRWAALAGAVLFASFTSVIWG